jgi:hypothetical protein
MSRYSVCCQRQFFNKKWNVEIESYLYMRCMSAGNVPYRNCIAYPFCSLHPLLQGCHWLTSAICIRTPSRELSAAQSVCFLVANSQCSGVLELGDLIHTPINHHMVRCLLLISDVASLQFTSWVQRFTSPCTDTLFKQNIIYPLIWLVHIISIQPSVYIDV